MSFWGKKKLIVVGEILSFQIICLSFLENLLEFFSKCPKKSLSIYVSLKKLVIGHSIECMAHEEHIRGMHGEDGTLNRWAKKLCRQPPQTIRPTASLPHLDQSGSRGLGEPSTGGGGESFIVAWMRRLYPHVTLFLVTTELRRQQPQLVNRLV